MNNTQTEIGPIKCGRCGKKIEGLCLSKNDKKTATIEVTVKITPLQEGNHPCKNTFFVENLCPSCDIRLRQKMLTETTVFSESGA